jgi:hypothetical protein
MVVLLFFSKVTKVLRNKQQQLYMQNGIKQLALLTITIISQRVL